VLAPGRPPRLVSSRLLGLVIPAAALVAGVVVAQAAGGADFLTALAAVATPVLAAGTGWVRGWRRPWLPAVLVPPLYAIAWLRPDGLVADAAGVALIAGACLAITGLVAAVAPPSWLTAGLVLLVVLDVILVWGDRQVEPTMTALQAATAPKLGRPLPELQQVDFGSATMGWLDFAAPALLGLLVARRLAAALATGVAAGLWGLLLFLTSPIAATPPVLAGLLAGRKRNARRKPARDRARITSMSEGQSLDGRTFRVAAMDANGEASEATVFEYHERDGVVWARYTGGAVRLGFLVGTRSGDGLDFRYSQLNESGETSNGHGSTTISTLSDGRLRLDEDWEWESKPGAGTSAAEEVPSG
jgi:hypothetical protein